MAVSPILLDYLEPAVVDFSEKPAGEYDAVAQVFRYNQPVMAGTSKTQSYQNSTTAPSVITGCEDYDDQYVTTPD
jgi:hypothetical protein